MAFLETYQFYQTAMTECCFHGLELKILIMHLRKDYEEVGIETAEGGLHIS